VSFKKRAPKAIKEIKAFATKSMVCLHSKTTQAGDGNGNANSASWRLRANMKIGYDRRPPRPPAE